MYVVALTVNVILCAWCILQYQQFALAGLENPAGTATLPSAEPGREHVAILQILGLNAVCGLGVALLAVRLVRGWISRPIAALHVATNRISGGDLHTRVHVHSRDELGDLAADVNEMSSTVLQMQRALAEQERRAVTGRALRCIVHNIRSPLTGVRWLAEAVLGRRTTPEPVRARYGQLIRVVDSILDWLQAFRHVMTNASLHLQTVDAEAFLSRFRNPLGGLSLCIRGLRRIAVDPAHLVPAVEALVTAAAGRDNVALDMLAESADNRDGWWRLRIRPQGFSPEGAETVNADSGGIMMAESIVQIHHGSLHVQRDDAGLLAFDMFFPGAEGHSHGEHPGR